MYETKPYFYGTGRRKDSVARVRVYTGTGKITHHLLIPLHRSRGRIRRGAAPFFSCIFPLSVVHTPFARKRREYFYG